MNIKVGIIGGSGYTGVELLRILDQHPNAEVTAITSRALQGKKIQGQGSILVQFLLSVFLDAT